MERRYILNAIDAALQAGEKILSIYDDPASDFQGLFCFAVDRNDSIIEQKTTASCSRHILLRGEQGAFSFGNDEKG